MLKNMIEKFLISKSHFSTSFLIQISDTSIITEKNPKVPKIRGFLALLAEKSEACASDFVYILRALLTQGSYINK